MDRLISLQAAIDAFKKELTVGKLDGKYVTLCSAVGYEGAKQILESLPSAQPEPQWIPCSERIPHTNGIYIVTRRISDGFECRNITDSCYFDGSNTWHDDTRVNHERKYLADVLAWMPLPEPWRGEE